MTPPRALVSLVLATLLVVSVTGCSAETAEPESREPKVVPAPAKAEGNTAAVEVKVEDSKVEPTMFRRSACNCSPGDPLCDCP